MRTFLPIPNSAEPTKRRRALENGYGTVNSSTGRPVQYHPRHTVSRWVSACIGHVLFMGHWGLFTLHCAVGMDKPSIIWYTPLAKVKRKPDPMQEPMLLTVTEVMERTRTTKVTVLKWMKEGTIPSCRLGGKVFIPREKLDRILGLEFVDE